MANKKILSSPYRQRAILISYRSTVGILKADAYYVCFEDNEFNERVIRIKYTRIGRQNTRYPRYR